ncbi:acyltransferase [Pseudorhodoferax aquiterrae]|uniref:Acyltransferase n=1 Tax=Pseudorhodoferax aquiterrae TaxID=747304 RepID=A0ABQ3FVW9_9BURK|nr:acyltransferase [Pseudorhodoferax aquiterrae]
MRERGQQGVSRGLSVYLDLLRFLAALAVFVLHASFERFSGGLPFLWRFAIFGHDAVMLFFVLSGFVIAHVATREAATPGGYAAARLARLWSVCVPALLLTLVVDGIGLRLAPHLYDFSWYGHDHPAARTVASLLFANELWFWSLQPFSNTPYWSVGYEFWYYVLFGTWLFTRGHARWLACGLVALVMGPKIALLLPVWLAGVWAYRTPLAQRLSPLAAGLLCAATLAGYLAYRDSALPQDLARFTAQWLGSNAAKPLGWSANFLADYLVGALVALHFVGARRLLQDDAAVPPGLERAIRTLAGHTFALYLFHNPLLQFFGALAHWLGWWEQRALPVVLGPLIVVWLLGARTERLKGPLKAALLRAFARRARAG